jgi:3-deoxy-7-phosphoheptulonate synthase
MGRREDLVRGQSITDACLDWGTTESLLEELADGVATRRRTR